jgi:hypothetical protein
MKYAACVIALGLLVQTAPAAAQEVIVSGPEVVTYYAPSVPVTTYYAPPVTTYYAPAPVTSYYYAYPTYYAPVVRAYYPAPYYVPPRVARRWYRAGYYW